MCIAMYFCISTHLFNVYTYPYHIRYYITHD